MISAGENSACAIRGGKERFGRIDVCVANAGGPPAKNFLSIPAEEWRKAVELNLMSTVQLAKAVIPYMQRHRWGRIITITSISVKWATLYVLISLLGGLRLRDKDCQAAER